MTIKELVLVTDKKALADIPDGKLLINCINAWSFVVAQKDKTFASALTKGDYLIPDGISIVKACKFLRCNPRPLERVAGADLFQFEMEKLNARGGRCFFMGSSENVLDAIRAKAATAYPKIEVKTYSPPFKETFSPEDDKAMIDAINDAKPDLLWIGLTAPGQEKWVFSHWGSLNINCHCGTIGAVFDFFAGTIKRAPQWWQSAGLEWLYRLLREPKRMWRRYLCGNPRFVHEIVKEKLGLKR